MVKAYFRRACLLNEQRLPGGRGGNGSGRAATCAGNPPAFVALTFLTAVLGLQSAHGASQPDFAEFALAPGFEVLVTPALVDGIPVLYVIETNDEGARFISRYRHDDSWARQFRLKLGADVQLYDVVDQKRAPRFVVYAGQSLQVLDESTLVFEEIAVVPSIYRGQMQDALTGVKIAKDLNGDGLDDLMIPDFSGWQVVLQLEGGLFEAPSLLGPGPLMGMGSERHVYFRAREPYWLDHNLDGSRDLAFWNETAFSVNHLNGGHFNAVSEAFVPGLTGVRGDMMSLSLGSGEQSDVEQKVLGSVQDLNGDSFDDVLVMAFQGDSIFGIESRLDVHLGRRGSGGMLEIESTPSSVISDSGIQVDSQQVDLDNNGTLEVMVTSVDFGVGTVIRALIARTVGLQLRIYAMADSLYPTRAVVTRNLTATVSLSEGQIFVPAILASDVNGDGRKDLVVQDGQSLRIFYGTTGPRLFLGDAERVEVPELPKGRDDFSVFDLDGDRNEDLVLILGKVSEGRRVATVMFR